MGQQEGIQINKYISSSGFCSRREADKLILQGRVTINGREALPTSRVGENDKVAVDDETIKLSKKEPFYIAFNKPKGITSTTDTQDKSNIISYINHNRRIFPVGRLDKDSEGLILLTDDGDIVNKILRAENRHEKEYLVTVNKPIAGEFINKMASGVPILDTVTLPCKVRQEGNKKFRIILTQGLNRQIRRMCEYMGYEVVSLKRIRIMNIKLGELPVGKFRKLLASELQDLQENIKGSSNETFEQRPKKISRKPSRPSEFKGKNNVKPAKTSFSKDKPSFTKDKKDKKTHAFSERPVANAKAKSKNAPPIKKDGGSRRKNTDQKRKKR
jgi:23S rRNA pseudouridine2604 synthase